VLRRLPLRPDIDTAEPVEVDRIAELLAGESRPHPGHRPWVLVNMVTSADGGTATTEGVSGDLGSEIDTTVFGALRSVGDVILAGSTTVTAERYRPARVRPDRREQRVARGQDPVPRIAVVSNRGDIDLDLPLFADAQPDQRPLVLVATGAIPDDRRHRLSEVAEVIDAGTQLVDPTLVVARLGEVTGARIIVCEGGATLNGLLLADDLIDEWCLTMAPVLIGGISPRGAHGSALNAGLPLTLDRAWLHDDELLLRYLRRRDPS
jgi:riboflavin biosynthesis pyrimidine reductase